MGAFSKTMLMVLICYATTLDSRLAAAETSSAGRPRLTAKAPAAGESVKVDGVLDEAAWKTATATGDFKLADGKAPKSRTRLLVMRDDKTLYIAVECFESPETLASLKAGVLEHDGGVWNDDDVEVFIDPTGERRTHYQVIVNSRGTTFDAYHDVPGEAPETKWEPRYASAVKVGPESWVAEFAFPLDMFDQGGKSSTEWGFNVTRFRSKADEYVFWSPVADGHANQPGQFGRLCGMPEGFGIPAKPVAVPEGTMGLPPETGGDSAGADWPHFLGPDRNGWSPEKGLLRKWPEGGPKLLWKAPMEPGYGSPSVSRGSVYLHGRGPKGWCVCCLDAITGEARWEFKYDTRKADKAAANRMEPGWGGVPRATTTVTDKYVYAINEIGELYCLERETGKEVWYRDLDLDYKPSHNDWKGWCASPVVVKDIVILPVTHSYSLPRRNEVGLVGLDARTGKTVWEYVSVAESKDALVTGGNLFATPQVADFAGERCVVWPVLSGLIALRAADGKKVWECPDKRNYAWLITPQVMGGWIFQGRLLAVDREKAPFQTRPAIWDAAPPYSAYMYSLPVRMGTYLYGFFYMNNSSIHGSGQLNDLRLACLDLRTGKETWKKENLPHGVSIMAADGLLFVRSRTNLILLEAAPDEYREKGRVELQNNAGSAPVYAGWVMPVLAHGRLYVRCDNELRCFQAGDVLAPAAGKRAAPAAKDGVDKK